MARRSGVVSRSLKVVVCILALSTLAASPPAIADEECGVECLQESAERMEPIWEELNDCLDDFRDSLSHRTLLRAVQVTGLGPPGIGPIREMVESHRQVYEDCWSDYEEAAEEVSESFSECIDGCDGEGG